MKEKTYTPILKLDNIIRVNPAIDFKNDKGYFGVYLPVKEDSGKKLFLVTSDREIVKNSDGIQYSHQPIYLDNRWSIDSINGFLESLNSVDKKEVFEEIKSIFQDYIEFPDPRIYDFISLWVIGTYLFPLFKTYPYVYIGGLKETGKTKCLHLSSLLSFNSIFSTSVSSSALFRLIQDARCSLFMDESEKLNNPERATDFRSILLSGYKRSGKVQRTSKDSKDRFVVESFEVYSPKMISSIYGLEDVLESRCIKIVMRRTLNKEIGNAEIDDENPLFQEIRDKLYVFALENFEDIKKVYDVLENETDLPNRDWELWHPIFALAGFVDKKIYDEMVELAIDKSKERVTENITETAEYVLVQALMKIVEEKAGYVPVKDIKDAMIQFYDEEQKWLNSKWIGRALSRLGFSDKRRIGTGVEYRFDIRTVSDIANRLQIATTQSSQTTQTTLNEKELSEVSEVSEVSEDANRTNNNPSDDFEDWDDGEDDDVYEP